MLRKAWAGSACPPPKPAELLWPRPQRMLANFPVPHRRFRCVTPSWDNAPRRVRGATIFHGSTPERYEAWLRAILDQARREQPPGEQVVFVNACNERGEGNHLEPDQRWGLAYLDATRRAVTAVK